jgi:hypothetical protein
MKVDSDNYFDVAEALHAVLTLWHGGQYSETYALLCRSQFKPGMAWSESSVEEENPYFEEIEALAKENNTEELSRLMNDVDQVLEALD